MAGGERKGSVPLAARCMTPTVLRANCRAIAIAGQRTETATGTYGGYRSRCATAASVPEREAALVV